MKTKFFYLGILFISIITHSSCNDSKKKENVGLQKHMDGLDKLFSHQISREEAKAFTKLFRTESVLDIPLAWEFEKDHLLALLDSNNIAGVRFYTGINPNTNKLTLIAVAVNHEGDDIIGEEGAENSLMYEFAAPCPAKCPTPNNILMIAGEDSVLQEFERTPASVQARINRPHP